MILKKNWPKNTFLKTIFVLGGADLFFIVDFIVLLPTTNKILFYLEIICSTEFHPNIFVEDHYYHA